MPAPPVAPGAARTMLLVERIENRLFPRRVELVNFSHGQNGIPSQLSRHPNRPPHDGHFAGGNQRRHIQ